MSPVLARLATEPCHASTYLRAWASELAARICDEAGIVHVGRRIRVAAFVESICIRGRGEA